MYGLFAAAIDVCGAIRCHKEEKAFYDSLSGLDIDQRMSAIKNRKMENIEERRHRELCQAIRESKPDRPLIFY